MYTPPTALRSVLDPKYLKYTLSKHYDIGEWDECLYWLRGLNDTYRIQTHSGYYILRVYRLSIKENDVTYELSLLTQLKNELYSVTTMVSEPIFKKDNSLYTVLNAPEKGKELQWSSTISQALKMFFMTRNRVSLLEDLLPNYTLQWIK